MTHYTYRKPATHTSASRGTYHDFEMESGISKKVNCLTAFAIVALIVALSALSLALMLLFQAFQTAEMEIHSLSALQERVKQLEDKVGLNSSMHDSFVRNKVVPRKVDESMTPKKFPNIDEPLAPEEPKPTQTLNRRPDDYLQPTHEETLDDSKEEDKSGKTSVLPPEEEDNNTNIGGGQETFPEENNDDDDEDDDDDDDDDNEGDDKVSCNPPNSDDEDYGGSGDCPVHSRPICPAGYKICYKGAVCPQPVCRKA